MLDFQERGVWRIFALTTCVNGGDFALGQGGDLHEL